MRPGACPARSPSVKQVFGKGDSDSWIEASGICTRLLHDHDDDGERHQRFVLNIGHGQTVLVAHNVDLAERIPLGLGDRVRFRGLYEWNEEGGMVHWTHHDPMGVEDGGFIELRRKRYR